MEQVFSNYSPKRTFDDDDPECPWHRRLVAGQMLMASDVERALLHVVGNREECVFACEWISLFLEPFFRLCVKYELADSYDTQWEERSPLIEWPSVEERDTMLHQLSRATETLTMPLTRETRYLLFPFLSSDNHGYGSHFTLLVLDRLEKTVDIYDPAGGVNVRQGAQAAQRLQWLWRWLHGDEVKLRLAVNPQTPQQRDGWACGYFVIAYAAARVHYRQPVNTVVMYSDIVCLLRLLRKAYESSLGTLG